MVTEAPPDPWSIRVFYIFLGAVISAIVGWFSSQVNHYRDSRKHHLEQIKKQVLEPLKASLQAANLKPIIAASWQLHTYNPDASASEIPVAAGPVLVVDAPHVGLGLSFDEALLEDARTRHYADLIGSIENFRDTLLRHVERREHWVEELAKTILAASGLDAHPAPTPNGPYVMQRNLAVFVYDRLMQVGQTALSVTIEPTHALLTDGGQALAKGTPDEIRRLPQLLDSLIKSNKERASQFEEELKQLYAARSALSHRLSYEIAANRLPKSCDLVPFFQW